MTFVVLVSLLLTLTYFTPCSTVSIVNFEHVIAGWVIGNWLKLSDDNKSNLLLQTYSKIFNREFDLHYQFLQ